MDREGTCAIGIDAIITVWRLWIHCLDLHAVGGRQKVIRDGDLSLDGCTPARYGSVWVASAGVVVACCDAYEGTCRISSLGPKIVVAPAYHRAIVLQAASVFIARVDLNELFSYWGGALPFSVVTPTGHSTVQSYRTREVFTDREGSEYSIGRT